MRFTRFSTLLFAGVVFAGSLHAEEAINAGKPEQVRAALARLTPEQKDKAVLEAATILGDEHKTLAERTGAIRSLELLQSPDSIAVLRGLLDDPALGDDVRIALQRIPSPAVPVALLTGLRTSTDARLQAGLIESLGILREEAAVPVIADLLRHSKNVGVVEAGLGALEKIGTSAALDAVYQATVPAAQKKLQGEALLGICEKLLITPKSGAVRNSVVAVLENLSGERTMEEIAFAALLLRIQYGQLDAKVALNGADTLARKAAIAFLSRSRDIDSGQVLLAALPAAEGVDAVEIIGALVDRRQQEAVPALRARLAKEDEPAVKVEVIKALGHLGYAADVPTFARLAREADPIGSAAREALYQVRGERITATFVELITDTSETAELRKLLLGILVRRPLRQAVPGVLPVLSDADGSVRMEALKTVERLATRTHLAALENARRGIADETVGARLDKLIDKLAK